jgi:hypothetical protein
MNKSKFFTVIKNIFSCIFLHIFQWSAYFLTILYIESRTLIITYILLNISLPLLMIIIAVRKCVFDGRNVVLIQRGGSFDHKNHTLPRSHRANLYFHLRFFLNFYFFFLRILQIYKLLFKTLRQRITEHDVIFRCYLELPVEHKNRLNMCNF